MLTFKVRKNKSSVTVTADAFLPGRAYKEALSIAKKLGGEIGTTADNRFKVNFVDRKTADKFVKSFNKSYEANKKPETPAPKKGRGDTTPTPAPTPSYKKLIAPYKGKGSGANSEVSHLLRAHGFTGTWGSEEWAYWMSVRG